MKEHVLSITRGDSQTYNLTFTDEDGVAIDITGWTIFFTVKTAPDDVAADTGALISKTVTSHTTPASGITKIELLPSDTSIAMGKHYFDIQAKTDDSVPKIITVMKGRFEVTYDISRRTT